MNNIAEVLFGMRDEDYKAFTASLLPTVDKDNIVGVRTPQLRALAKEMIVSGSAKEFVSLLPHRFFDENQLHAFILNEEKNFEKCVKEVDRFLPFIDNWATCDQLSPKIFYRKKAELPPYIEKWLGGGTYSIRFAVGAYMRYFLGDDLSAEYFERVVGITSDEYYVNMMRAWYFATALAKNYDFAIGVFERRSLDVFTHNAAIKKACESFRVGEKEKAYLKTLKR